MEKILILGGGGHSKPVIDAIRAENAYDPVGIIDPGLEKGAEVLGVPVLGGDGMLEELQHTSIQYAAIGIGSKGDNRLRRIVYNNALKFGFEFPMIVHPSAIVSNDAHVSEGCQVMAGAVLNPSSYIGLISVINTGVIVEHDCHVGENVFTGPGAVLCGSVEIGKDAFIGASTCFVPGVKVKRSAFVPALSLVTKDSPVTEEVLEQ